MRQKEILGDSPWYYSLGHDVPSQYDFCLSFGAFVGLFYIKHSVVYSTIVTNQLYLVGRKVLSRKCYLHYLLGLLHFLNDSNWCKENYWYFYNVFTYSNINGLYSFLNCKFNWIILYVDNYIIYKHERFITLFFAFFISLAFNTGILTDTLIS